MGGRSQFLKLTFVGTVHDVVAQITVDLLLGGKVLVLRVKGPVRVVEGEVVVVVPSGIADGLQAGLQEPGLLGLHLDDELGVHVILAAMERANDISLFITPSV